MGSQLKNKILSKIYYDLDNVASFSNKARLLSAAKRVNGAINKHDVDKWYNREITPSLWRSARKKFPRNRVITKRAAISFQIDLMDMGRYVKTNAGYRYVLICVDTFSRYAACYKQKNKTSSLTLNNLKKLRKQFPQIETISSDLGGEFTAKNTKKFLKDNGISLYISQNREIKACIAERFIRTLRLKFMKYFTHTKSQVWHLALNKIVENYNKSPHRSIKMAPIDVIPSNYHIVRQNLYPESTINELAMRKKTLARFSVGQTVRISRLFNHFEKDTYQWTLELFRIKRVIKYKIPLYILADMSGQFIEGSFYPYELLPVNI